MICENRTRVWIHLTFWLCGDGQEDLTSWHLNFLVMTLCSQFHPHPLAPGNYWSAFSHYSFLEFHIYRESRIVHNLLFWFLLLIMFLKFIQLLPVLVFHSLLLLCYIPLIDWQAFGLFPVWGQRVLWIMLQWTFVYKSLCGHIFPNIFS